MKVSPVNFWTLASVLAATSASANICNKIVNGTAVNGNYVTLIKPEGYMEHLFESPDKEFQVVTLIGEVTRNYYTYKTMKILVRNKLGEAIYQINDTAEQSQDCSYGNKDTIFLNRTVFSPDGSKILLVIDDPQERSHFGRSNQMTLIDVQTRKAKVLKSDIVLDAWQKYTNPARQEDFPVTFSADSKTVYLSDEYGIEVFDVASGKRTKTMFREEFGYETKTRQVDDDDYGKYNMMEEGQTMKRVAFSPDQSSVMVSYDRGAPAYHDFTTGKSKHMKIDQDDLFTHFGLEDHQNVIGILSSAQMSVVRWNAKTGKSTTLLTNPSRKTTIQSMVSRNGVSVAQVVETNRDWFSENFVVFNRGSQKSIQLDVAATKVLKKQATGYGSAPSTVYLGSTGEYAMVVLTGWYSDAFVFNTQTGALVGKLDGRRHRFAENGKAVLYKAYTKEKNEPENYTRVELP